ncbi:hypothetical protein OPV22_032244 [Ensete ventricosum]|uniref:Uncharacterized protein n=1 Tax=Ensete ventricosum TaxID=4639 RepID=A0AAV8PXQ2_ENSVE|nr:hypothetical protein OPV22_032244 [Ensete ventricosum]
MQSLAALFLELPEEIPGWDSVNNKPCLWSIYLDQEIRLGDEEVIHALFERATCLSWPPKKMKFLFTNSLI